MPTVNEKLDQKYKNFTQRVAPSLEKEFVADIDNTRTIVNDLLMRYARKDGKISKSRLNSIVRELESYESQLRKKGKTSMSKAINQTSTQAITAANTALIIGIGAAILATIVGVSASEMVAQIGAKAIEGVVASLGITAETLRRNTLNYVLHNEVEDGLTFIERWWASSGELRADISKVIRRGVLQEKTIQEITKDVKKVYQDHEWKVRRLVQTEVYTGYRKAIQEVAKQSKVVKALKIVDHPGDPHHETHECYIYAHRNEYGMGKGVYPVGTQKILRPHPQCTSTLHFVTEVSNK